MAIGGYHINGPADLSTGTGSAGALETLGYTGQQQGVDVEVQEVTEEILTDIFGGRVPNDLLYYGEIATIRVPLIASDRTVLKKVLSRGDRTTAGLLSTPALVLGAGGYLYRVAVASPADEPWNFAACYLRPGYNVKLRAGPEPFVLTFLALPFAASTVTNGKDVPLYTRTIP